MEQTPTKKLSRITTEYIDSEDRFRITGQVGDKEVLEVWLTQRLLLRLLPHHFQWLEKQADSALPKEIVQSFAQQAAKANLKKEPPVKSNTETQTWIAHAVDIAPNKAGMGMRFKGSDDVIATLSLPPTQLRQWLTIVRSMWQKAQWPMDIWPEWMEPNSKQSAPQSKSMH